MWICQVRVAAEDASGMPCKVWATVPQRFSTHRAAEEMASYRCGAGAETRIIKLTPAPSVVRCGGPMPKWRMR